MRIHSDTLTAADLFRATEAAGMTGVDAEVITGRSTIRSRGFTVKLTGNSPRRQNTGNYGADYYSPDHAATWDEWGMFFNALFAIDPRMVVGTPKHPDYYGRNHFDAITGDRFRTLAADDQHRTGHLWEWDGGVSACRRCDAIIDRTVNLSYYRPEV